MSCHVKDCNTPLTDHHHYCDPCLAKVKALAKTIKKAESNARILDPFYEDDWMLFTELASILGSEETGDEEENESSCWRKIHVRDLLFKKYYNIDETGVYSGPTSSRVELLIKYVADMKTRAVKIGGVFADSMQDSFVSVKESILIYRMHAALLKGWIEKSEIYKKQQLAMGVTDIEDVNSIIKKYLINM